MDSTSIGANSKMEKKIEKEIKRNNSYDYLIKEHDECTRKAMQIVARARENFHRPAYAGTIAEVGKKK